MAGVALALVVGAACSGDNKERRRRRPRRPIAPAPTTTTAPPAAAPKFTFGFVAPSAPLLLDLAYAQENALSLAVADINDGGGVLGAPVKATTTDDQVAGSVANAVTDLVKGGANAVLGPVGSTDAQAAIPAVAGAGSLACSASATVSDLNSNPPVGRLLPDRPPRLRDRRVRGRQRSWPSATPSLPASRGRWSSSPGATTTGPR